MTPRRRLRIVVLVLLLRAHADDAGCTPEEAASYREMAANLLDRWWPKVHYPEERRAA